MFQSIALFCLCLSVLSWTQCSAFSAGGLQNDGATTRLATRLFMSDASFLLYQDQQNAMLRRSEYEETLLPPPIPELEVPSPKDLRAQSEGGGGFGAKAPAAKGKKKKAKNSGVTNAKAARLAQQQSKILHRDGVLRIDQVLTPDMADRLRQYVLDQEVLAAQADPAKARSFYGVEQARANRCDLQLSLLRGGFAADEGSAQKEEDHVLADALQELLGSKGTLRPIYETLVTPAGELYELATVVTHPGSDRQMVHPDLPFQDPAPLYVIFLALQDVTAEMGPTCFLLQTHTASENAKFENNRDPDVKDEQLKQSQARLATLQKGDAVLFDARILHCGTANDGETGSTRALFNFSFRNPEITGPLGYEGSIRPGYCQALTLKDMGAALESYQDGELEPFAKYGSGL